jgi:pimeloyl-ACP methyl ester carboxylesterase
LIYLIPGLGADHRVFKNLDLKPFQTQLINWLEPIKGESLTQYAKRLGDAHFDPNEEIILIGLSMGGMIAKEMMQYFNISKCIILSSVQVSNDFSPSIKLARIIKIHKLIPITKVRRLNHLTANYFFSVKDDISKRALHKTIDETDPWFLEWSIDAILNWKNEIYNPKIFHIHGNKDRIFPVSSLRKKPIIVKGGGHWMVVEKGKEISEIILKYLRNTP